MAGPALAASPGWGSRSSDSVPASLVDLAGSRGPATVSRDRRSGSACGPTLFCLMPVRSVGRGRGQGRTEPGAIVRQLFEDRGTVGGSL
jgi:hypothetical protein